MLKRRHFIGSLTAATFSGIGMPAHSSPKFPSRALTILVGFPPGGGVDGPLRQVAQRIGQSLGVAVVVENVPGANQMLAIRRILAAEADGHTLFAGTAGSLSQNPTLNPALGYEPLRDFSLIGRFATSAAVLVVPASSPYQTLEAFIAAARAQPGKLLYASAGIGSTSHIGIEVLAQRLGISLVHVPYRGDAAAAVDTAEGRVDLGLNVSTTLLPFLPGGKLRLLASTGAAPLPFAPDVRPLARIIGAEASFLDPYTFYGLVGPKGLPDSVVQSLGAALSEATSSPAVGRSFRDVFYAEPLTETPAQFRTFLSEQKRQWSPYVGKFDQPST